MKTRGGEWVGDVERLDPALDALVAPDARVEVLAEGFKWSEGDRRGGVSRRPARSYGLAGCPGESVFSR